MYSLGQSSPSGSPGTFIFGFKGVGGEPITVDQPLDPVADIPITDGETSVSQDKNLIRLVRLRQQFFRLLNTGARRVIKRAGTAGAGAVQLTNAQAAIIRTIDELAHNWKVKKTLSGEILDPGRIKKIEEGMRGLDKAKTALQSSLQNPNLTQTTSKAIQLRIDTVNRLITRAKELLGR